VSEHLTSQQVAEWLAGDPPAAAARHARECAACRSEVESLRETMTQFRESGRLWRAHQMAIARPRRSRGTVAAGAIAALASVVAAAVLLWQPAPAPVERPFVAVPYVAPLAPYERASIQRMDVPVAALVAAGFQVNGIEPGGTVTADVLVGQDGRVHAVRLISNGSVIQ